MKFSKKNQIKIWKGGRGGERRGGKGIEGSEEEEKKENSHKLFPGQTSPCRCTGWPADGTAVQTDFRLPKSLQGGARLHRAKANRQAVQNELVCFWLLLADPLLLILTADS